MIIIIFILQAEKFLKSYRLRPVLFQPNLTEILTSRHSSFQWRIFDLVKAQKRHASCKVFGINTGSWSKAPKALVVKWRILTSHSRYLSQIHFQSHTSIKINNHQEPMRWTVALLDVWDTKNLQTDPFLANKKPCTIYLSTGWYARRSELNF